MCFRKKVAGLICAVLIGAALSQSNPAQNITEEPIAINHLFKTVNGEWRLDKEKSDDVLLKMREKIPNPSMYDKTLTPQNPEAPSLSISLFPPEILVLAESNEQNEITINEAFQNILLTRTFQTSGQTQHVQLAGGANFTVRAIKKGSNVIVETVSPRGNKMTEIYELTPAADRLYVTLHIENPDRQELITLHRVYNRATVQLFINNSDTDEIQ